MADHSLTDDAPDTAPPVVVEAKLTVASLITLAASMAFALLNAVQHDSSILGSLPPWLQFVLITVVPPLATFLAGYAKTSNRVGP